MVLFCTVLYTLLLKVLSVNAIFVEDAFVSDWQIKNIGRYRCVMEDPRHQSLIVISDFETESLVSFLNETSGTVTFRQPLAFRVIDAMMLKDGSGYLLKDENGKELLFDTSDGFPKDNGTVNDAFVSSCAPNLNNVIITNNTLQLLDEDSQLDILKVELRADFDDLSFFYTDNLGSIKLLYSTSNNQYIFESHENGVLQNEWIRDESISNTVAHIFVDAPNEELNLITKEVWAEQDFSKVWDAYTYRVSQNWARFKLFLKANNYSPGKIIMRLMKMDRESLNETNDLEFGLMKYLIVASEDGLLAAIDVRNGSKVWDRKTYLNDIAFVDFLTKEKEILLMSNNGTYTVFDARNISEPNFARTGQVESTMIECVSRLSEKEYLIHLTNGFKRLFSPDGIVSQGIIKTLTFHDVNGVHGAISKDGCNLHTTWETNLGGSEEIIAFARKEIEPISNIGVTLGNRTVLYKYLNPNLASYIVSNDNNRSIYVYLIDTVTGELLYSQYHDENIDVDSPVNIVFGDNWFIYSFFSTEPIPEQRLVVVELYESLEADHRVLTASDAYDPFKPISKPVVKSNAYFFPEVIKRMAVSRTKYGIALSAIILELENGQITYLSKGILSARRQSETKMTDNDKKEFMAMPYISTIPLNDHFIITHSRGLLMGENAQLTSIATNLESTSIICDIGHDIFCTKIYPSGQFDTMNPSFEKGKLLATILGLFVLCYLLRPMVESSKLKSQWLVRT